MNALFAACAERLGAAVCAALGWRPDEFWAATPAEVAMALGAGCGAAAAAGAADLARMQAEMGDG